MDEFNSLNDYEVNSLDEYEVNSLDEYEVNSLDEYEVNFLNEYEVNTSEFIETLEKLMEQGKKKIAQSIHDMAETDLLKKLEKFFSKLNAAKDPRVFNDFDFVIGAVLPMCLFVINNCGSVAIREDFCTLVTEMRQSIKTAINLKKVNRNILFELVELENWYWETANKCINSLNEYDVNTSEFIGTLEEIMQQGRKKTAQSIYIMTEADLLKKLEKFFSKLNATNDPRIFNDFDFVIGTVLPMCLFVINNCGSVAIREDFRTFLTEMRLSVKTALNLKKVNRNILFELIELENWYCRTANKSKPTKQKKPASINPLSDFREINLLPTSLEVNRYTLSLVSPVLVKGPYDSVEHYLDSQFRLLREDFVDVIRSGLKSYRNTLANKMRTLNYNRHESVRVYSSVRFEKCKFSESGNIAYVVSFDPVEKITANYEVNRNFMRGSLLLFSRNEFQTFFCATIHHRDIDMLNIGKLYVTVEQNGGDFKEDFLFDITFKMIEAEAFWEPYSLVLRVLQSYSEESFPMRKYVVETSSHVTAPPYLHSFREWDVFGHCAQPLDLESWPRGEEIGLDEHQYNALKTALTKQFCVIQGPPGTGKTFLGLKIVQILLANMNACESYIRNPILVVCYTNHALDQFLEGILEFDTRIIRVGGQSRNEKLDRFNFKEKKALRRNPPKDMWSKVKTMDKAERITFEADRKLRYKIGKGKRKCSQLLSRIDQLYENLEILNKPKGILSFDCLAEVIASKDTKVLNSDYALIMWLLDEREDNFPSDHKANNVACLDELKYDIVIDENTLKKEMYGKLLQTEEENASGDNEEEEDDDREEEVMTYSASLNGLGAVCLHHKKELDTVTDKKSIEYTWAKNNLIVLIHRYFILKENLEKTLVDEMLYEKTSQKDPLTLHLDHRWNIYFYWVEAKKKAIKARINSLKDEYRNTLIDIEKLQQKEDASILATASVVGMTTTGAARCHRILEMLKPSIVIVEEAAEVLEAHVVASLNEYTQHVILIGDHKQLKPSTAAYELSKTYNLDCSLFERMLNNGMYCPVLTVQHRMRPEISSLITPSIYKKLENHVSVHKYGSIKGMLKNVFFVNHTSPDSDVENSTSYVNFHEAAFVIELCAYLLDQGYDAESITLLTTYAAQVLYIKQVKNEKISKVRVCVVDEYQGEENDIVILSLVRSNPGGHVGFLKIENRVCVALSRAKKGFYMIGNMTALSGSSSLWRSVNETLVREDEIGPTLTLRCEKHGTRTLVATAEDFNAVNGGGCNLKCGDILPCSHICAESCHIADPNHENEFACALTSLRTLECGHTVNMLCSVKVYLCKEKVEFNSPTCEHTLTRECFNLNVDAIECESYCAKKLRCGHECPRRCHPAEKNHDSYVCQAVCGKKNKKCSKNHTCTKPCGEMCGECSELERFHLKCGHTPMLPCSTNPSNAKCPEVCGKMCAVCRKPCQKQCWEDCQPCTTEVRRMIYECGHFVNVLCSVVPTSEMCDSLRIVSREAACGHDLVYGVPCGISQTDFDTRDYLANCQEPCNATLICGHNCTGTCGECIQGRLHVGCRRTCEFNLHCGHECVYACGEVCPPCCDYSFVGCRHTRSRRKCGSLYFGCPKRCESKCKHKACTKSCGEFCNREPCFKPCEQRVKGCNHPCIGFCGEPCICRWCDTIKEFSQDKRFVKLEDCKCVIESEALEKYMNARERNVCMYACPQCEQPIVSTGRFLNRIKNKYKQIIAVSKRVHGLDQQLTNMRSQVTEKLKEFFQFNDEGLDGLQRMKMYFSHALSDKHNLIKKQNMAAMNYFVELFNTVSRRVQRTNKEMRECQEYRMGTKLVSQVLDRVEVKTLLKSTLMMNSLRMELIRMHRILDFCLLVQETSTKKLMEEDARLVQILDEIQKLVYTPKLFGIGKDRNVDKLFDEFLRVKPSDNGGYSFRDWNYLEIRYQDFLSGTMTVHNWVMCPNGKHLYPEVHEESECPEC